MPPEALGHEQEIAKLDDRSALGPHINRAVWLPTELPSVASMGPACWLVFLDSLGLGQQIVAQLMGAQHRVIEVSPEAAYKRIGRRKYQIRPGRQADFDELISDLKRRGISPQKVVYLWTVGLELSSFLDGCGLLSLARAFREHGLLSVDLAIISNCLQSVSGEPNPATTRLSLLAEIEKVTKEFPELICRSIDCDPLGQGTPYVAVQVIAEQCAPFREQAVAYRRKHRFVESRDQIEEPPEVVLAGWWRELLGLERVDLDDDFFDLGGHSLIGVQLFNEVKKRYGLELGLSILFEARTIRQLARYIHQARHSQEKEARPWSPLVPIQPKGDCAPLFVVSGLGGNVIKFHNLAFHLGDDQPIYGLLPRGLDGKAPFHTRIEEIASDYVEAIRNAQPEGPYQLAGYSFGGVVAFEVAQQLLAQECRISLLVLLDTIEWHYQKEVVASLPPGERLKGFYKPLEAVFSGDGGIDYLKQLLAAKSSRMRKRLFEAVGRHGPQKTRSIEEVNSYALVNYQPKMYIGKVTLFRSTKRTGHEGKDEHLGWGRVTTEGVEVHEVGADHFDILQEPAVKELAQKLRPLLRENQVVTTSRKTETTNE